MKSTATAHSNIALIKYWGRDPGLKPFNSSLAVTMDDQLATKTTVEFSDSFEKDRFVLNEVEEIGMKLQKVTQQLEIVRKAANSELKARVISENSFPHAAGLASSASGFCALTAAAARALGLRLSNQELSTLAALGPSGSASRSFFGGFVEWNKVKNFAFQRYNADYWPELRNIIVIVDDAEKKIQSNEAMQQSVGHSLYKTRILEAEMHLEMIEKALQEKNTDLFFTTIMKESDSLHRMIERTTINYLNENSQLLIKKVKEINESKIVAGYTFDAGPNAHVFTTADQTEKLTEALQAVPGVQKTIVCKAGEGVRLSDDHLEWKN